MSSKKRGPGGVGQGGGRRTTWMALGCVALMAAAACTSSSADAPLPPAVPAVDVSVTDDDATLQRPVPAGRVVFHIHNRGQRQHPLALFPFPDDAPPIDEELANDTERAVQFRARVAALAPNETGSFAVDLAADQRYVLADFSSAPDGTEYMNHGVAVEFRAQRQPAATPATP